MKSSKNVIAVGEAAHRLRLSPQRVRELVDSGQLQAERSIYGMRLISAEAVEAFLAQRTKAQGHRERSAR